MLISGIDFNEPVACDWLLAASARLFAIANYYGYYTGPYWMPAVAFMASAPPHNCAGPLGIGLHHGVCGDDTYHRSPWHDPHFWSIVVGNALLAAAYGILWGGARTFDGKDVSILLALMGVVSWLIACSIGPVYARPEARAMVMAAIGIVYTLLVVFELWRGRGDEVWRWPIMVLLLAHAAAIPIHIPLAGAWTHPDPSEPSDLDLLTFAVFEGAFVCICAAYLFGGLAKDRIAARYRRASLTDPLTGIANHRAFFRRGERLLMRARFAREPTALILFDLDRFKSINDRYGHMTGDEVLISFCRLATSHLRPDDLFGRIGGEEFASLLLNPGRHDALWLAERVRKAFEATFHTTGQYALRSTVSVGVAISDYERSDSTRSSMRPIKRSIKRRR